jgi:hypothetical protein
VTALSPKPKRKVFRYKVAIRIKNLQVREMMTWLHDQGHVLHETVKFGANNEVDMQTRDIIVKFRKARAAMMFKLAWGGR